MLRLHNPNNSAEVFPLDGLGPAITHPFDGFDTLSFDIPMSHEYYPLIAEEVRISTKDNRFAVKSVDEHGDVCTVECMLDLDDWKERFWKEYRTTDALLSEVLNEIKPTGWTVEGAGISTQHKTIEASEGKPLELVNSMDILGRATEVYEVCVNFNVPDKRLKVIDPSTYTPSGEYLTDELNLRSISFMGSTTDFATRLYAYGKEGMTFADINGGKEYVEDFTYSDRILSVGWKDERYTIQENLLAAAKEKLKSLAFPERSYELDVIDLAKGNPNYSFLTFWLYQVVTLLDRKRGTRVDHQIVEYVEYPESPGDSTVVLSATMPRIENVVRQVSTQIDESKTETENFMLDAIENATGLITGAKGGYVVIGRNPQGQPVEILIMDALDIDTAQHVWRWNNGGFGHSSNGYNGPYNTAITQDGAIVADFITAGTMSANLVRAGVLASQNNRLKFDLDNALLQTFDANGNITMEFTERGLSFIHGGVTLLEISSDDAGNVNFAWRGPAGKLAFRRESTAYPIEEFLTIYPYDMGPEQEGGVHTFHLYPYSIDMNGENVGTSSSKGSISNVNNLSVWGEITAVRNNRNVYAVLSAPSGEGRVLQIGIESGNLTLHGTAQTFYIAITSSDEMLKDNIADTAEQALPQVNAIRHRSFTWKEGAVKEKLGYVAQELERINARWVDHVPQPDGEDMVQPRIDRIVPYLSKAIQELSARIDELERKVNADGN